VSPLEAGKAILKQAALDVIQLAVSIYDPCTSETASNGPNADSLPNVGDYTRIEDLFFLEKPVNFLDMQVTAKEIQNERIIHATYPFRYQTWKEPKLHQLRKKYGLNSIVGRASDEFQGMVLLRSWTRSQFRRRDYQHAAANFDALEILDRNHHNSSDEPYTPGKHLDPCYFFPMLYAQVMLSVGHQARLVSITHGMAEVWSNQYRKWVLMDAELDLHYEKNGVPLNMIEMLEENFTAKPTSVRIVRGTQTSGDENTTLVYLRIKEPSIEKMILYHRRHLDLVDLRNDWLTNHYFPGHPVRSERNSLVFSDPRLNEPIRFDQRLRLRTSNKEEFYWTLNQTEILANPAASGNILKLAFQTVTPNFDHFEMLIDETVSQSSPSPVFEWCLHPGKNTFSIWAVNEAGVEGIHSSVRLWVDCSKRN
jgi:hypothetical protein